MCVRLHRHTLTSAPFWVSACYDPLPGIKVCMCVSVCAYRCVCMCMCVLCAQIHPDFCTFWGFGRFWPAMTPFPASRCACVCVCAYRYVCMCVCEYRYTLSSTPCYDPLFGIKVMRVCVCAYRCIHCIYLSDFHTPL